MFIAPAIPRTFGTSISAVLARALVAAGLLLGVPAAAQIREEPIDPATIPETIRGLEYKDRLGQKIPLDLQFTDSAGKEVRLGDFFGQPVAGSKADGVAVKPVLMMLVYFRCPMQCPGMLARMQQRINEMDLAVGDKFNVLVVSFDPTDKYDAAAKLKHNALAAYSGPHTPALQSSWEYLTDAGGEGNSGMMLAEALGFPVRHIEAVNEYAHGSDMFVLGPDGTISRYLGFDPPAQTLRLSLVEASQGKIATTLDRILLWCFHFDPKTNSYAVSAWRFMQVAASSSALALGGLLWWMLVIERRRKRAARPAAPAAVIPTGPCAVAPSPPQAQITSPAGRRRAPARILSETTP